MNYGENLKSLRERVGLNLKQTAKLIDVSDSLYSRYEKEKQTIPLKHLIVLCDYFEVSLDYIFNFNNTNYKNILKNYDNSKISQRLKNWRKEHNLTQIKVANLLNIDQPTWNVYERGKNLIGTPFLYTLCKTYNISADYLLGRIDEPKYLKNN